MAGGDRCDQRLEHHGGDPSVRRVVGITLAGYRRARCSECDRMVSVCSLQTLPAMGEVVTAYDKGRITFVTRPVCLAHTRQAGVGLD